MGKNKKQKKWYESDGFIPAPKQSKTTDLAGFLVKDWNEGTMHAVDPNNKAAVVLAQVINDPEVKNVVTLDQDGIPEGLELYDPKTHKAVHKSFNTYDPQVERAIPKSWAAHDVDTERPIPKNLSVFDPAVEKAVDKGLYELDTKRYLAGVDRLKKAAERHMFATVQDFARAVLEDLGEIIPHPEFGTPLENMRDDVVSLEGPGWRDLAHHAKLVGQPTSKPEFPPVGIETEGLTPTPREAPRQTPALDMLCTNCWNGFTGTACPRCIPGAEASNRTAEQAWAEYNAARAAEGKTPSKTEPLIYDPTPLERPDMMIHQVNGEFAVWANGLQVPEGAFYPGGWVVGKFDEHGNWERHSTMPADSNATLDFVPMRAVSRKAQVTPVKPEMTFTTPMEQGVFENVEKRRTRLREVKPDPLERYQDALTEGLELLSKIAASTEQIAKAHKPTIATQDPEQ